MLNISVEAGAARAGAAWRYGFGSNQKLYGSLGLGLRNIDYPLFQFSLLLLYALQIFN
jgi:hypothetical protein